MKMKLFSLLILYVFAFCVGFAEPVMDNSVDIHSNGSSMRENQNEATCPSNWIFNPSKTKCFSYVQKFASWESSLTQCNNYGGSLATLASLEEVTFAQKLCDDLAIGCWVGGRGLKDATSFRWKWANNTSGWNNSITVGVPLGPGCTNFSCYNSDELCTLISNETAPLVAERCNASHPSMCMILIGNKCSFLHCHKEYLITLASVSGLILCTTLAVVIWLLVYKRSKRRRKSRKLSSTTSASVSPLWKVFNLEELRSITKNFSEGSRLPGDAKTGGTYCGLLLDGSRVAVKRLKRSTFQRKKEFYSEIRRVAKLHHPNLVAVKGCCYDHGERYIVYEYISNGPLDRWLHHIPKGGRILDWGMRMKVATTLAQGIAFLHDKVKPQVVHRDIRANNVLLDEDFGAHLMGVGLSKFVPWEAMHERTLMAGGTYGYLAPEFVYRNELTTKSDVYSFGVLLLEIISGRRPAQAVDSVGWQSSIFEWATPLVQAHRYPELLDPLLISTSPSPCSSSSSPSSHIPEAGVIQKVVDLVYACTQHVPSMRPRMSHVVHQLQQLAQAPIVK